MSKYQARVIEDPHDPNLRWLRVTHNGNSYSTIRIDSDYEILQMISALQQSVQADLATDCPNCGDKLFCAMCGEGVLLSPPSR